MSSMNPETDYQTRAMHTPPHTQMPQAMNPAMGNPQQHRPRNSWQFTRPDWLSTETVAYVLAVLGVILTCAVVGGGDDNRGDYFTADEAFLYITLLTFGYMLSRGLAKIGGRPRSDI